MAYRVRLSRFAFAVVEGAAEIVFLLAADGVAGIPEVGRTGLVGDIFQHTDNFSVLNFVVRLSPELKIVTLVVDAVAASALNHDRVLGVGDKMAERKRLLAGFE